MLLVGHQEAGHPASKYYHSINLQRLACSGLRLPAKVGKSGAVTNVWTLRVCVGKHITSMSTCSHTWSIWVLLSVGPTKACSRSWWPSTQSIRSGRQSIISSLDCCSNDARHASLHHIQLVLNNNDYGWLEKQIRTTMGQWLTDNNYLLSCGHRYDIHVTTKETRTTVLWVFYDWCN